MDADDRIGPEQALTALNAMGILLVLLVATKSRAAPVFIKALAME